MPESAPPPRLPPLPSLPTFSSTRVIPVTVADLAPVAEDVMEYFRLLGYDVTGERTASGGWHISLTKGSTFAAVLGLKTALNVELESTDKVTRAKAGVGIFGRQVVPVLVARFVAWPVWLTQIWGLVQQAKLDDEALDAVERSLYAHSTRVTPAPPAGSAAGAASSAPSGTTGASGEGGPFCTQCGTRLASGARFCSACGARVAGS
jgi:hypothetical protein